MLHLSAQPLQNGANPCKSASKKGRGKGFGVAVNLATQINTIKNWNYPEFNKTGIFWLFFRGDVHFWSKTWLRRSSCRVWAKWARKNRLKKHQKCAGNDRKLTKMRAF